MIPILYEASETAFVSNGLGRLRDCISCKVEEQRNGLYECTFEYPVDGAHFDDIRLGRIIAVEHDDTSDVQPFDIVSYERTIDGIATFRATHISYRQSGITTSATNVNSISAAFTAMSNGLPENPFSYETDITSSAYMAAFDGIPRSVRQLLGGIEGSVLDTYGGEYEWDKWRVILHASRGQERSITIRYGLNLVDYNETLDYSESFSSVIPYWYQDEKGLVKGDMVSSSMPTFDGRVSCVPLDLTDKFEDKPTKAQVEAKAATMISQAPNPKQTISVDFIRLSDTEEYKQYASLQQCKLCDTLRVEFPRYGMSGRFKIVQTVYDVLMERFESMELGDLSTTLSEALGLSDSAQLAKQGADTTTATDIMTLGSGVTISDFKFARRGNVAQLYFTWSYSSAITVSANGDISDITLGTLKDDYKPIVPTAGVCNGNPRGAWYGMTVNGVITSTGFNATGSSYTIAAETNMNARFTYLVD